VSEPATQRRPWWKLHFSTKVVIAVVVCGLILANLPGQQVMHVDVPDDGKYGPHYGPYPRYEHGWPNSYMVRQYPPRWGKPRSVLADSCWALTHRVESFTAGWLVLDIFLAILAATVIAAGFEVWRRRRKSLWRFRLIELFGLLTSVACAGGWYQWQCRIAEGEAEALKEAHRDLERVSPGELASDDVEYERGGPTFLRQLIGDQPFACQDRVVSAIIIDSNPRFANRFPHLKCIAPGPNELDPEAALPISQLRGLQTLDLFMGSMGRL
jgi:hypothetical protein